MCLPELLLKLVLILSVGCAIYCRKLKTKYFMTSSNPGLQIKVCR
jgi:hypothetical protein